MFQDMIDYLEARVGLHGLDDERYHTNIPEHLSAYVTAEEWQKSSIRILESEFADLCDRVASEGVKDEELVSRMSAVKSRLEEMRSSPLIRSATVAEELQTDDPLGGHLPIQRFVAEKVRPSRRPKENELKKIAIIEPDTSPVTAIETITQSLRLGMMRMGERIRNDTKHILSTQAQQEDSLSSTGAAVKRGQQFRRAQSLGLLEVARQFVIALILVLITLYLL